MLALSCECNQTSYIDELAIWQLQNFNDFSEITRVHFVAKTGLKSRNIIERARCTFFYGLGCLYFT